MLGNMGRTPKSIVQIQSNIKKSSDHRTYHIYRVNVSEFRGIFQHNLARVKKQGRLVERNYFRRAIKKD